MTDLTPLPPVPIFRLFLKMGGWIVLIVGVFAILFTLVSQSNLTTAKRFEKEGRAATALVSEKYSKTSRNSEGRRKVSYYLGLEYETDAGEDISLTRKVNKSEYGRATQGETVQLIYLPSEPRKTELTSGSHKSGAKVTQMLAFVFGIVWLVGLWIVGGWAVSGVRARRYGTREEAQVIDVRKTRVKVNNQPRYRLVWREKSGREGKSLLYKAKDLTEYGIGDTVIIYQGIKHSWWAADIGDHPNLSMPD